MNNNEQPKEMIAKIENELSTIQSNYPQHKDYFDKMYNTLEEASNQPYYYTRFSAALAAFGEQLFTNGIITDDEYSIMQNLAMKCMSQTL